MSSKNLLRKNSNTYSLLGFFHNMNMRELMMDSRGTLPLPRKALEFQVFGYVGSFVPTVPLYGTKSNKNLETAIIDQMTILGFSRVEAISFHFYCFNNFIFVFKPYQEEISIFDKTLTDEKLYIDKYFETNQYIPQIMSESRLVKELSESHLEKEDHIHNCFKLDLENYKKFCYSPTPKTQKINKTKSIKKEKTINELPPVLINDDYIDESKELGIDLFSLQKKINETAEKNGGFVSFEYKYETYKIPRLPLLCWATLNCHHHPSFSVNGETWTPLSPEHIKTGDDDAYHTDWWIGAGFPLMSYRNSLHYKEFNELLTEFAFSCIDEVIDLDNIKFLAGKKAESIMANLVNSPKSLDDFNEDDAIILPNADVDYEPFLLKACKNGKGAVIVENGNRFAHLSVVSKEFNKNGNSIRLILLPNATNLLADVKGIYIDVENKKIKQYYKSLYLD